MELINIEKENFNVFEKIGKEWMLISAYDEKKDGAKINTMTASWGGAGVLWNKNVFFCFVRPQRYTKEFIDAQDTITLSFFGNEYREALTICGRNSGRDCDKIALSGLTPKVCDGAVFFEQAKITLVGKKLFCQELSQSSFVDKSLIEVNYPDSDFHTVYVCEIVGAYKKD